MALNRAATGWTDLAGTSAFTPHSDINDGVHHAEDIAATYADTAADLPQSGNWVGRRIFVIAESLFYAWAGTGNGWNVDSPILAPIQQQSVEGLAATMNQTGVTKVTTLAQIAVDLDHDAIVQITLGGWIEGQPTANGVRVGIEISGATASAFNEHYGEVAIKTGATPPTLPFTISKTRRLAKGLNTINVMYQETASGGASTLDYPVLTVTPLRWA